MLEVLLLLLYPLSVSLRNLSNHLLLNVNAIRSILLSPVDLEVRNSTLAKINCVAVLTQNIRNHQINAIFVQMNSDFIIQYGYVSFQLECVSLEIDC